MSLEQTISTALHGRADGGVDIDALVERAKRQGDRERRRHQLFAVLGVAALVGTIAVVPAAWPGRTDSVPPPAASTAPPASPQPSVRSSPVALPLRPPDAGIPAGSAGAPGTNPYLYHLDVDGIWELAPSSAFWSSYADNESLMVNFGGDRVTDHFAVSISRKRFEFDPGTPGQEIEMGGQPATLWSLGNQQVLRWQPVPGLWARLDTAGDRATAVSRAGLLRLDRAYRCVAPIRLKRVPNGARVTACNMMIDRYGGSNGGMVVQTGSYHMTVGAMRQPLDSPAGVETRVVNGRRVEIQPAELGNGPYVRSTVGGWTVVVGVPRQDLLDEALVVAGWWEPVGGTDPATWTATPLR